MCTTTGISWKVGKLFSETAHRRATYKLSRNIRRFVDTLPAWTPGWDFCTRGSERVPPPRAPSEHQWEPEDQCNQGGSSPRSAGREGVGPLVWMLLTYCLGNPQVPGKSQGWAFWVSLLEVQLGFVTERHVTMDPQNVHGPSTLSADEFYKSSLQMFSSLLEGKLWYALYLFHGPWFQTPLSFSTIQIAWEDDEHMLGTQYIPVKGSPCLAASLSDHRCHFLLSVILTDGTTEQTDFDGMRGGRNGDEGKSMDLWWWEE